MERPRVDLEALNELLSTLNQVKDNNGYLDSETLWSNLTSHSPVSPAVSMPPLSHNTHVLRSTLKLLKAQRDLLSLLQQSLEDSIPALEAEAAMHGGIHRLPDEILLLILHLAHDEDVRFSRRRFMQVCRRFRVLTIDTSDLWKHISFADPLEEVQLSLTRSKSLGLAISVPWGAGEDNNIQKFWSFMNLVIRHRERWEWLDWRWYDMDYALLQPADFPRLKWISYYGNGTSQPSFLAAWSLPSLIYLIGRDFTPLPSLGLPHSLTYVDLYWDECISPLVFSDVFLALQACPALEKLILFFNGQGLQGEEDTLAAGEIITFTQLAILELGFCGVTEDDRVLYLMAVLDCPHVTNLSIILEDGVSDGIAPITFMRCLRSFPSVKTLRFSASDASEDPEDHDLLGDLLLKLPALLYVSFDRVLLPPFGHRDISGGAAQHPWSRYPALQKLHFRRCPALTAPYLDNLIRILRAGPHWHHFKELKIDKCSEIDEGDADALREKMNVSDKKLMWSAYSPSDDDEEPYPEFKF